MVGAGAGAAAGGRVTLGVLGHVRHLSIFLLLLVPHPAVLEPDLDLAVRQLQPRGHLQAPRATQVRAEVELFLQLQQLAAGEGRPLSAHTWPSSARASITTSAH